MSLALSSRSINTLDKHTAALSARLRASQLQTSPPHLARCVRDSVTFLRV